DVPKPGKEMVRLKQRVPFRESVRTFGRELLAQTKAKQSFKGGLELIVIAVRVYTGSEIVFPFEVAPLHFAKKQVHRLRRRYHLVHGRGRISRFALGVDENQEIRNFPIFHARKALSQIRMQSRFASFPPPNTG